MKLFKRDKVTFGAFNLNQQGGLDLNDFIIPRTDPDYRIANIYDVNKDGLNDLIVYNKSTIYWMKNIGSGAYSAPLKVKKIWSNKSNIEVIEPGLIVIEKDEDESVDYLILDFRGEKEPAIFRFNQGKLEPWIEAIYLDNLGYYSVFFDDSQSLCIKSSRSNRTIKQRGITRGQYSLADFDNDGLLDIVTIDSMRVIINWGYKDGSFIQGIDLLQVDELIENGELIAWAADSKYTSEEVIELSLN